MYYLGNAYSGHSLRVGFAVSTKDKAATLDQIQTHDGWLSATKPMHYTKQTDTKRHSPTQVF